MSLPLLWLFIKNITWFFEKEKEDARGGDLLFLFMIVTESMDFVYICEKENKNENTRGEDIVASFIIFHKTHDFS